jgi:hypothetical protein
MKLFTFLLILVFSFLLNINIQSQTYFQQEVNYQINVKLDDSLHFLHAYEEIEYINNSPDHLSFIYFHLWPNAYENNETALAKQKFEFGRKIKLFRVEEQRGYIDSLNFMVNGKKVNWEFDPENIDICKIILNENLFPGESILISTPFRVKIPKGNTSRLGHIEQEYSITQWYPKPAVYDNKGWHQMPYLNMGEFYSEFGSFDVSISVPQNYVVAATGNMQDDDELAWLNQKAIETAAIKNFDLKDRDFPVSSKEFKTLRFTESNVHDFAWFADKRFHVLKNELVLPNSKRKVTTWAFFPNRNADLWVNASEYINDAVYYYSLWYGDYPYENCSAVHAPLSAGGGMEYPTITVIGNNNTAMALEMVIMHEVGHNWFYGILASDERTYPWMDEGINSFSDRRYMMTKYPDNRLHKMIMNNESTANLLGLESLQYNSYSNYSYLMNARRNLDQAPNLHTNQFTDINYGVMVYSKSSIIFSYLMNYLGEEKFNQIMQDYFETWKFKHPYPEDFQTIVEKHVNEDLSWFFDDLLGSTKKLDYKLVKSKDNKLLIKNKGSIISPVLLDGIKGDSMVFSKSIPGFEKKQWVDVSTLPEVDYFHIDNGLNTPDINSHNNLMANRGLHKRINPVQLKMIGLIEDPIYSRIGLLPAMGYNYYDKFMLGGLVYHSAIPMPAFEYQLMPLYSFGTKTMAGMGKIRYIILPSSNLFRMISMYASGMQFGYDNSPGSYYQKFKLGIETQFVRREMKKPLDHIIRFDFIYATNYRDIFEGKKKDFRPYYELEYEMINKRRINPYNLTVQLQSSDNFVKANLEAIYEYTYIYSKSLQLRFFGGAFLYQSEAMPDLYAYTLSSSGISDYSYDALYLARFENPANNNLLAQQFAAKEGGFSTYSVLGQSTDWLLSLNVNSSLPINNKIPIRIYANMAIVGSPIEYSGFENSDAFYWEAGAKLSVIRNVFEFYFPVIMSDQMQKFTDEVNDNYWQQIRFTLYLNKLNPFEMLREL